MFVNFVTSITTWLLVIISRYVYLALTIAQIVEELHLVILAHLAISMPILLTVYPVKTPTVTHVIKLTTVACVFQAIILIKMGDAVLAYQIVVSAQTYPRVNFVLQATF